MLAPILKDVKNALGDAVKTIKINVDKNQPLTAQYLVKGVPTTFFLKMVGRSGVVQKLKLYKLNTYRCSWLIIETIFKWMIEILPGTSTQTGTS